MCIATAAATYGHSQPRCSHSHWQSPDSHAWHQHFTVLIWGVKVDTKLDCVTMLSAALRYTLFVHSCIECYFAYEAIQLHAYSEHVS